MDFLLQEKPGENKREQLALQAGQYYDSWMENGGIFQFEYEILNSIAGMQNDVSDGRDGMEGVFPVRGIAAVLFITGIYGAVIGAEDERRNLYVWADRQKKAVETDCPGSSGVSGSSFSAGGYCPGRRVWFVALRFCS